jgi:hypothetical protein
MRKEIEMEVYVADGTTPISEGYNSIEELLADTEYLSSYAFIEYVWEDGTAGRLTRGVDY